MDGIHHIADLPYRPQVALHATTLTKQVGPVRSPSDTTFMDAWSEYFDTGKLKGENAKTAKAMMERYTLNTLGTLPIKSINRETLVALHESAYALSAGQGRTLLKVTKPFLNYACRTGMIDENPIAGFKLALPNTSRTNYTIRELGRVIHLASLHGDSWKRMSALSLATTAPLEEVRNMRCEEIDWQRKEWKISQPSSATLLLLGGRTVPLSSYALWLLEGKQGKVGYVFQSPRTRHNGQNGSERMDLPLTWRSSITEAIRQHADIPGPWSMRDMRLSAATLSGFRRASADLADAAPEIRQARLAATMEAWGRRLWSAVDDCISALSIADPVIPKED
jgi:hypothetical protein